MFRAQIPAELIRSDIEVDFVATRNGAHILDSLYEATLADAFCLEMGARAESEGYAAVCINSMSDSGVSALRSRLSIPVVGPGQASFLLAAALGKRFSVITMWQRWDWIYEKLARETGLQHALVSIGTSIRDPMRRNCCREKRTSSSRSWNVLAALPSTMTVRTLWFSARRRCISLTPT